MITLQDCLGMCDISEEVIDVIAEREHLPQILAAELATTLASSPGGLQVIHGYLIEDAATARGGRRERCEQALRAFLAAHPELSVGSTRRQ